MNSISHVEPAKVEDQSIPSSMVEERTHRPLRIAIAYSRLPFPMMRGDQLTIAHLVAFLSARGHSVDLYTLDLDGEMTNAQEVWLENACNRLYIYRLTKFKRAVNLIKGLCYGWPMQVGYFFNRDLARDLTSLMQDGSYDILYCYYLRSAPAVPAVFKPNQTAKFGGTETASFLAMQLSQTLNSRRIFENEKNLIKKCIYGVEWALLRSYEARIWKRFTKSILIGPEDVKAVRAACQAAGQPEISNWIYGAHGTDVGKFNAGQPDEMVEGRIVFSGSMLYQPNVQAILWFVENCWDEIKTQIPSASLFIVGRDPLPQVQSLAAKDGITVTGRVPDVGTYIRQASVCINPMLAAGGMQNKLIEYMACARPVVATTVANEGIGAPAGTALVIANDADKFIEEVVKLLGSKGLATTLGDAARSYVLSNWTWESHFRILENNFYEALDKKAAGSATQC